MFGSAAANSKGSSSDIECLRSIKDTLRDPQRSLSSWDFTNSTLDFFCSFNGVECSTSSHVQTLRLGGMGLVGEFPRGVAHCSGLTALDLSDNPLHGSIPVDISTLIAFTTLLDLSNCKFSAEIPADIANCRYLRVLKLNNNFLTGRIPASLASLRHLKSFTVANNLLEGAVPRFRAAYFPPESYAYNAGLCGDPLGRCGQSKQNVFRHGFLAGWCVSFVLFLFFRWFRPLTKYVIEFLKRKPMPTSPLLNQIIEDTMISRLEKFAVRMKLVELRHATGNFSENNVVAVAEMGITYKATLSNGWCLAVKRLSSSPITEHEFLSEITVIGRLRHRNLVPLFGFCEESNDRFLIHKFMPNGTLHDCLFSRGGEPKVMEWGLRAKIAAGVARGIAWLHANGIVHRGITSKCIMLDEDFNPRISDFGKAATLNHTRSSWERGVSVLGCCEEDVHSFGKVLLELMTGRRYNEIVRSFDMDGDMLEQISVVLNEAGLGDDDDEMMCCLLRVAAKCLECDPCSWPSMKEVCQMLSAETTEDSAISSSDETTIQFVDFSSR